MNIVLIHGFSITNTEPEFWEKVVFGDIETNKIGRATAGLCAAIEMKVLYGEVLLLFGAGIPTDEQGRHESEIERDFIMAHLSEAFEFSAFRKFDDVPKRYSDAELILSNSICDFMTENSHDTTEWALSFFGATSPYGNRLVIASDENHLLRCLKEASAILYEQGLQVVVSGIESGIPYSGEPGSCVVIEPPMREVISEEIDALLALGKQRIREAGNNPAKHYQDK